MYNKTIIRFGFCDIQNNQGLGKGYQPQPSASADNPYLDLDYSGYHKNLIQSQAAKTLFVIYIRDSIALRFKPFKRMYENGSKIALNSTCSKGFK